MFSQRNLHTTTKAYADFAFWTVIVCTSYSGAAEYAGLAEAIMRHDCSLSSSQTFNRILDYLESSNKIVYDKQKIIWVFPDNPKLKKLIETSVQLR
jgi:hypothetical protein